MENEKQFRQLTVNLRLLWAVKVLVLATIITIVSYASSDELNQPPETVDTANTVFVVSTKAYANREVAEIEEVMNFLKQVCLSSLKATVVKTDSSLIIRTKKVNSQVSSVKISGSNISQLLAASIAISGEFKPFQNCVRSHVGEIINVWINPSAIANKIVANWQWNQFPADLDVDASFNFSPTVEDAGTYYILYAGHGSQILPDNYNSLESVSLDGSFPIVINPPTGTYHFSIAGHGSQIPPDNYNPLESVLLDRPVPIVSNNNGNIIYNPPTEMTLGTQERIEVRIANGVLNEIGLLGRGVVIRDEIPISQHMSVRLCCEQKKGGAFNIEELDDQKQIIDFSRGYTQWTFIVTPRKSGEQILELRVSSHYTFSSGDSRSKTNPVMLKKIRVTVDAAKEMQTWLVQYWQWLGLLLLISVLVFSAASRRKSKKLEVISSNGSVFISYRRNDSSGYTLAIYQKLKQALGDENVFMDLEGIPHGVDFTKYLEKALGNASTVLVMIGEDWLSASNDHGRRLDNPKDFVRIEVATALERDIRVIPVLLKNAQMPNELSLPEVLRGLSRRNAIHIHDDQFDASVQRLVNSLR